MTLGPALMRAAVVGVGNFGQYHADKYAHHPDVKLCAVVDRDLERAQEIGRRHGVPAFADHAEIGDLVDAISVATPATSHYRIAAWFLERNVHVLVEKPITTTLADADDLIRRASGRGLVLQVGHQERYYFADMDFASLVGEPKEIYCRRVGPFSGRGLDCNVVLDLMIHDIDLVHQLAPSEPTQVSGTGEAQYGPFEDVAEVTLGLDDGCRVSLTASRAGNRRERSVRLISATGTLEVNLIDHTVRHCMSGNARLDGSDLAQPVTLARPAPSDLLAREIDAFIHSVSTGRRPLANGEDGRRALKTALLINRNLRTPSPVHEAELQT